MYCKYCGEPNPNNAKFCHKCGQNIQSANINTTNVAPANNIPQNINTNNGTATINIPINKPIIIKEQLEDGFFFKDVSKGKMILIYAIGVLLTVFIAMVVFAEFNPQHFYNLVSYISRFFV